jgi:hypothetical protein
MSLEKIKSSANEEILTRQGRLLCSPRDAAAEACVWVEKYKDLFESTNSIGVIGAGAGFHVLELEKRYPGKNILVFDLDSALGLIQMPFKSRMIINADADIIRKKIRIFSEIGPFWCHFVRPFSPSKKNTSIFGLIWQKELRLSKIN